MSDLHYRILLVISIAVVAATFLSLIWDERL